MKNLALMLLCLFTCAMGMGSTSIPKNTRSGCDTLIKTDGQVLLIKVQTESNLRVRFTLCDDTLGKVYSMQKDLVGSLKYAIDTIPPVIQPATGKNYAICDTCDQITLTDGKKYFIRILDQDNYNYFYTICGDKDDRVYMMPVRRVRSLRRAPKRVAVGKPGSKTSSAAVGCLIALGVVLLGILALLFAVFLLSL